MHITILTPFSTRSVEFSALEQEYTKRIRGRFSLEQKSVKHDAALIEELKKTSGRIVLLDEKGSVMNSREFAKYMERTAVDGGPLTFVIGGAEGLPDGIRELSADIIALSEMTFPHQFAKLMLIEQIYRAQTIIEGHPYHK